MNSHKTPNFLSICPHLQSEWTPLPSSSEQQTTCTYQHIYSCQQSESRYLESVTMKNLDVYSSREAYSFPFCPKIYKYVIQKNRQECNQLMFDIMFLMEKVTHRLKRDARLNCLKTVRMLLGKVNDIVSGFSYLHRRFGLFKIKEEMIGWTNLGVVKVWLNEDYGVNNKADTVPNQETMVLDLVRILSENGLLRCSIKKSTTFDTLLKNMVIIQTRTESELIKKQVSFGSGHTCGNLSNYRESMVVVPSHGNITSPESRKNITFSYSNKDLSLKTPTNLNQTYNNKRVSIQIDPNQINTLVGEFTDCNECSGMTIKVKSPTISSAKGYRPGGRTEKKLLTYFKSDYNVQENSNEGSNIKKLKEHFTKTTKSSIYRKEVPTIDQLSRQLKQNRGTPQFLHHTTSSNPISKLFKARRADSKTYSTKGSGNYTNYPEDQSQHLEKSKIQSNESQYSHRTSGRISRQYLNKAMQTFEIQEEEVNLRQSQEVQNDLDALFHSDHEFDYNALQNELDCIL